MLAMTTSRACAASHSASHGASKLFWPSASALSCSEKAALSLLSKAVRRAASGAFDEAYLLFQLIFLGAIMPLYAYRPGRYWTNFWPRALGISLLIYGLLALS